MRNKFIIGFALAIVCVCAIAATLQTYPIYVANPTLIQTGTCFSSANGVVSNTFTIPYTTIPTVTATQLGVTNSTTNFIVSISLTNFVINSGSNAANISNIWTAIGNP